MHLVPLCCAFERSGESGSPVVLKLAVCGVALEVAVVGVFIVALVLACVELHLCAGSEVEDHLLDVLQTLWVVAVVEADGCA